MSPPRIVNALVSTSDKLGLADFARGLTAAGVRLISTGGTRAYLENQGIDVTDVSAYTGFPEIMDGRVKTLHPRVHGGILFRRDHEGDVEACREHGIDPIDLVVVNLYPFQATIARGDVTIAEAIEQIDIGGPTLIRAAAKNHAFTTVATDSQQYSRILEQIEATGMTTPELRRELAGSAFEHTARYDRAIADYFVDQTSEGPFPRELNLAFHRRAILRYGENPHQSAALYVEGTRSGPNRPTRRKLCAIRYLRVSKLRVGLISHGGRKDQVFGPSRRRSKHRPSTGCCTALCDQYPRAGKQRLQWRLGSH